MVGRPIVSYVCTCTYSTSGNHGRSRLQQGIPLVIDPRIHRKAPAEDSSRILLLLPLQCHAIQFHIVRAEQIFFLIQFVPADLPPV